MGHSHRTLTNVVLVALGERSAGTIVPRAGEAARVLDLLVRHWEAEWAVAVPRSLRRHRPGTRGQVRAGWVTWVRTPDGGRWWSTGEEPETATPEAAAAVQHELTPHLSR